MFNLLLYNDVVNASKPFLILPPNNQKAYKSKSA